MEIKKSKCVKHASNKKQAWKTSHLQFTSHTRLKIRQLVFLLLLIFLLVSLVHAITIEENVQFKTKGTNTTYIIGKNITVDNITVYSTVLSLSNSTDSFIMSAIPSSGSINITIIDFTSAYRKWSIASSNPSITVSLRIGGFSANREIRVDEDNVLLNNYASNSTGWISFIYSGSFPTGTLEANLLAAPSQGTGGSTGRIRCREKWDCAGWSDCVDNKQTRICIDSNNCRTTNNKPAKTRPCSIVSISKEVEEKIAEKEKKEEIPKEEATKSRLKLWIIIVVIALTILTIIYWKRDYLRKLQRKYFK
mgnify:CR=1 FL=1